MSEHVPSKEIVPELRGVDNRPELAQIYLRHLCLRAADEIERLAGECRNWKQLHDADEACIADLQRQLREAKETRAALEPGTDRLALLERALHQIKNGCVDDDDRANELFRLTPGELRRIAVDAIAGVGEFAPASPQPPGDDRELLFDLYLEINSTDNAPLIPYGLRESIAMQRLRNVVGEYLKATRPTKGESR